MSILYILPQYTEFSNAYIHMVHPDTFSGIPRNHLVRAAFTGQLLAGGHVVTVSGTLSVRVAGGHTVPLGPSRFSLLSTRVCLSHFPFYPTLGFLWSSVLFPHNCCPAPDQNEFRETALLKLQGPDRNFFFPCYM